jgi:hypothetical protein
LSESELVPVIETPSRREQERLSERVTEPQRFDLRHCPGPVQLREREFNDHRPG